MVRFKGNTVKVAGLIALLCLSLACFAYINSVQFPGSDKMPEQTYVEELAPEGPEVLPDVELVKRLVKMAIKFMSLTNL